MTDQNSGFKVFWLLSLSIVFLRGGGVRRTFKAFIQTGLSQEWIDTVKKVRRHLSIGMTKFLFQSEKIVGADREW